MTNGIKSLSQLNYIPLSYLICTITFLLTFGGICVNMQAISFITQTNLNITKYLLSKIILAVISSVISFVISFFVYKDTQTAFTIVPNPSLYFNLTSSLFLFIIYIFIICVFVYTLKKEI